MGRSIKADETVSSYVKTRVQALVDNSETYNRLQTILRECGWTRRSRENLARIQATFEAAGIFPEPRLTTPGLPRNAIIRYQSKKPEPYTDEYYAPQMGFPDERAFAHFVKTNFRRIEAFSGLRDPQFEHTTRRERIDLLCRDRRTEAYVAVEFKRDGQEALNQLIGYMRTLRTQLRTTGDPSSVRGIVLHFGPEWPRNKPLDRVVDGYEISWYRVTINLAIKRID